MSANPSERFANDSVVDAAVNLGWGSTRERLAPLAEEPAMEARFALLALQRHLVDNNDEQGVRLLEQAWQPAMESLRLGLHANGYTEAEISQLMVAEAQLRQASAGS